MNGSYEKRGVSIRFESNRHGAFAIETSEHGVAWFESERFVATSRAAPPVSIARGLGSFEASLQDLRARVPDEVELRRLFQIAGSSEHRYTSASEDRSWTETSWRTVAELHSSSRNVSTTLQLGGEGDPSGWENEVVECATILAAPPVDSTGEPGSPVALSSRVVAELIAALASVHTSIVEEGLTQTASDRRDGVGRKIETAPLSRTTESLPNVFRPSYRSIPVRMPIDSALVAPQSRVAADSENCRRIDLLVGHVRVTSEAVGLQGLGLRDGSTEMLVITGSPDAWLRAVVAETGSARWYPNGTGVWARGLVIDSAELEVEVPRVGIE